MTSWTQKAAGLVRHLSKRRLYITQIGFQYLREAHNRATAFVYMMACILLSLDLKSAITKSNPLVSRQRLLEGQHDKMKLRLRLLAERNVCARVRNAILVTIRSKPVGRFG